MVIDWPLIIVLFCLSIPGTCIAVSRLIYFLLPNNTDELKKRMSRFAIMQTLFMVFVMSFAGAVLSFRTGLHAPVLETLLQGKAGLSVFQTILLPTLFCALSGLIIFLVLYYGLVERILDEQSLKAMTNLRRALRLDGCVLYGGVVEEVIARWGLMNLVAFFAILFVGKNSNIIIWTSIILSGLMFAIGQIPVYLAAGCLASRRLIYSLLLLFLWQSLVFGFLFWQYGMVAAIFAHMFFHFGWFVYDSRSS